MNTRARSREQLERLRRFLDEERGQLDLVCRDWNREVGDRFGIRIEDAGDAEWREALEAAREAWQAGARAQSRAIAEAWRAIFRRIDPSLEPGGAEEDDDRREGHPSRAR
jgi:hypothetical protein